MLNELPKIFDYLKLMSVWELVLKKECDFWTSVAVKPFHGAL